MALVGTSQYAITGDARNYVQGDQNITVSTIQQKEKEYTDYDEVRRPLFVCNSGVPNGRFSFGTSNAGLFSEYGTSTVTDVSRTGGL